MTETKLNYQLKGVIKSVKSSIYSLPRFMAFCSLCILYSYSSTAQTATDGLMMPAGKFCNVLSYTHDQWNHYWEGTLKRENFNLGKVTNQNIMYMGAFGITKNINVMVGLPFIWTKASAGTLQGRSGLQDLSLDAKWRALKFDAPLGSVSVFGVLGFSTPMSNYTPDFLPLSIGLHTTTGSLRGILHYQTHNGIFATVQGGYIRRSNTKLDRYAYYTDTQHNTNEVMVPDVFDFSPRIGYVSSNITAELWLDRFYSLSGNDIRRNDMPFPANAMRSTKIGAMGIYRFSFIPGFGITAGASYTLNGRNVGQSISIMGGITYIFTAWTPKQN